MVDTFTLFAISRIASGIIFEKGIETLILAGVGLTFASLLAKPVINLLLLPINLVTFNLFKWISSAIALYLVTIVIPGFKIVSFSFSGLTSNLVDIPAIELTGALAIIAFSFMLSLITSFIYWLVS